MFNRKETWSYSKIDTYKTCPYKFYLQYLERIQEPEDNLVAAHKGSFIHLLLQNKITGETDLEDKELRDLMDKLAKEDITKTLRTVKKFVTGEFFESLNIKEGKAEEWFYLDKKLEPTDKLNAFVQGKIDYIEKRDDYVLLIDWKTGKQTIKRLEAQRNNCLQLDIYALWALQYYHEFEKINTMLYYIESNTFLEKIYYKENIQDLKIKVAKEIVTIRKSGNYERKLGSLCDFCGYFSEYCNSKA